MNQNKSKTSNSKLEELKELERLYTRSKKVGRNNKKYKEFDLTSNDLIQYNDLIAKQLVIDEKQHFQRISMGVTNDQQTTADDEEGEYFEQNNEFQNNKSIFKEEDNSQKETESLLDEFYQEEQGAGTLRPDYNDNYRKNLKSQRQMYYFSCTLAVLLLLISVIEFGKSIKKIISKNEINGIIEDEESNQFKQNFELLLGAVQFALGCMCSYEIGRKLRDLIYPQFVFQNAKLQFQVKLCFIIAGGQFIVQVSKLILANELPSPSDQGSNNSKDISLMFWESKSLVIVILLGFILKRIMNLQDELLKSLNIKQTN